jgi:hypothetical protein
MSKLSKRPEVDIGSHARNVLYAVLFLKSRPDLIGELPRHLDGVHAWDVVVETLPLGDPRLGRVRESDDTLKDLRRAALDGVLRALQVEELLTVGAPIVAEALKTTY